ncbi:cellular tumor antigen p53 isoform X2 [Limanda limanda]|nr:cellular tumor antigen p53 isoform X2 [Limanda limanda]
MMMIMMMMHVEAQPEFFPLPNKMTWNEARNHCQVCYKELVTLTPSNAPVVAQKLTSVSWIGLRKHPHPPCPPSMPWSRWANGDFLTYQNWYPGWPVLKSPGVVPGTEDLCVATLNFGAWVEKDCSELLPYICYDERFSSQVGMTAVTTSSANFTWQPMAGNIDHYHVETRGGINQATISTNLTAIDTNLTANGTNLTTIDTNLTSIGTNLAAISTNLTAIGAHLTEIGTNLKAIGAHPTPFGTYPTVNGTNPTPIGTHSMTIGTHPTTIGTNPTSIGTNPATIGTHSTTISTHSTAIGTHLTAIGTDLASIATDLAAIATDLAPTGNDPTVTGTDPPETGTDPTATGTDPTATETDPTATGTDPAATGTDPPATGTDPTATGTDPTATGTDPTATGTNPTATGTNPTTICINLMTLCTDLTTIGANLTATSTNPTTIGTNPTTIGPNPTTIGTNPTTIGTNPTTIGTNPTTICPNLTEIGGNLTAIGTNLTAIGTNLMAIGTNLTDIDTNLTAIGANLKAIGTNLKAIGTNVLAIGTNPTAIVTNLTYDLSNLTAGTRYSIQVFPVKCGRILIPQAATFYTKPREVQNLNVTKVTETSVFLSWNKPSGHADFYQIKVDGVESSKTTNLTWSEVVDLKPGISHTFFVLSRLRNDSLRSEAANISAYTKPQKVSNLRVSKNRPNSLLLRWTPPEGNIIGYRVQAVNDSNDKLFEGNPPGPEVTVTGLPIGTRITLSVVAIAFSAVESDNATIVSYTAPAPITNLTLETTDSTLNATWNQPTGSYSSFNVTLQLDGMDVETPANVTKPEKNYEKLKNGVNYTVIVRTVSGHLQSPPLESSKFTLPLPPTDAKVVSTGKDRITFKWTAPDNTRTPKYLVNISSSIGNYKQSYKLDNITEHMFEDLTSGTKYLFQVQAVTDTAKSSPVSLSHFTEADEREISLSMLCSSSEPLLCAKNSTEESVFSQLEAHFRQKLGDNFFWKLEKQDIS